MMKKTGYLVVGLLAGAILSTAAGTVTAQVKSLIGSKVSAEYTVNVDGKQLSDKAIIVDNKAMVPLRSVSDSLGVGIKVDTKSKSINVTSVSDDQSALPSQEVPGYTGEEGKTNRYMGLPKDSLEQTAQSIQVNQIDRLEAERASVVDAINLAKDRELPEYQQKKEKQLSEIDEMIANAKAEKALVEAALAAIQ